jgi:MoxR-like ATPase
MKKSAKKRNEDYYQKSKLYLKIQRDLKDQQIDKSLSEIKTLTKDQLKDLSIDDQILTEIFSSENNLQSDQSDPVIEEDNNSSNESISEKYIEETNNEETKTETETETETETKTENTIEEYSGIDVVYPNWKNKLIENTIPYMERNGEIDLVIEQAIDSEKILNLCGESGIGKTLLCKTIAQRLQSPLIFVGCHDNLTSDDLEGSIQLLPNDKKEIQTKYVLGGIAQAIHCANNSKTKMSVLVFDEINTLLPNVQKILNNRTNFKEGIEINSIGLKLKLKEGCKIIALATQNPAHYNGTYPLNTELLSKILALEMEDLDEKLIIQLVKRNFKDLLSSELIENVIQFKNTMSNNHRNGKLDKGIDTREIISFCFSYKKGIENKRKPEIALRNSCHLNFYAKYSTSGKPDQTKIAKETIESCFGITELKVM